MASLGHVRVLFVDDEEDIVEAYAALLRVLFGWSVTPALSGKEALRHLRKEEFDVIVSDYRMPQMSGLEFLRKAKQVAPRTPFVMLTAYGDPDLEADSFGAGADRFLGKSENPRAVAASIQEILGRPGATPGSKAAGKRKPPRQGPPAAPGSRGGPSTGQESFGALSAPSLPGVPILPAAFEDERLRPDLDLWGR